MSLLSHLRFVPALKVSRWELYTYPVEKKIENLPLVSLYLDTTVSTPTVWDVELGKMSFCAHHLASLSFFGPW